MKDSKARELYQALRATRFNQSAASRVLKVSRETVRKWLLEVGGIGALVAKAVELGLASQDEAKALSAYIALALRNAARAKKTLAVGAIDGAKSNEDWHLRKPAALPSLLHTMTTIPAAESVPQSTTVRVAGPERAFGKRLAVELALKAGRPREDLSFVVTRMFGYFMARGEPNAVAEMLMEDPEPKAKK